MVRDAARLARSPHYHGTHSLHGPPASERDVDALWESFNDVAEDIGLNQDEMTEISCVLPTLLVLHPRANMDQLTTALFGALDMVKVRYSLRETRRRSFSHISHLQNGLADPLESLETVAITSAMTAAQKHTCTYPDARRRLVGRLNLTCCLPDSCIQLQRLQRDGPSVDRRANAGAALDAHGALQAQRGCHASAEYTEALRRRKRSGP
jgi:hypothetical protein